MLTAKRYAPMNARDKMPFEVTPIFYPLRRYDAAAVTPSAAAAPASAPARRVNTRSVAEGTTWPCTETRATDENAKHKSAKIERFMSTR